jgi:hypothetical protein
MLAIAPDCRFVAELDASELQEESRATGPDDWQSGLSGATLNE